MTAVPMDMLDIKHRIMTSPLAALAKATTGLMQRLTGLRHPEMVPLMREETALFALLPKLVDRSHHCLDVGAHIGSFAYQLQRLAPQGSLTLIEPLPRKAAMLRRRFPRATVHETAVSDTDGSTTFFENLDQSGFSSLANRASWGRTVERTLPQARLDTLLGDAQIDFIKIDVEGFEFAALKGAEHLITRCQPAIVFEAGAVADKDLDSSQSDALFQRLQDTHGYQIWSVAGYHDGQPPLDLAAFQRCRTYPFTAFNFVALPSNTPPFHNRKVP